MISRELWLEVLEDFRAWSGGFDPDEVTEEEVISYCLFAFTDDYGDERDEIENSLMAYHWNGGEA